MAKSTHERVKAFRERQKAEREAQEKAQRKAAKSVLSGSFSDYMQSIGISGFSEHRLILGNDWWDFTTDDGINPLSVEVLDQDEFAEAGDSLGKAELIMNVLEDMTAELARLINEYKRKEITARIAEIENKNLADAAKRKQALSETVCLHKMLAQLDRQVRWTFPQWEVTGE